MTSTRFSADDSYTLMEVSHLSFHILDLPTTPTNGVVIIGQSETSFNLGCVHLN